MLSEGTPQWGDRREDLCRKRQDRESHHRVCLPNGSRLTCGRNRRWRKEVEAQRKRLAGEATQFFPYLRAPGSFKRMLGGSMFYVGVRTFGAGWSFSPGSARSLCSF